MSALVSSLYLFYSLVFLSQTAAFSIWLPFLPHHGARITDLSPQDDQKALAGQSASTAKKPSEPLHIVSSYPKNEYPSHSSSQQDPTTFATLISALSTMQSHYFQIWPGTWPTSIDWTAAVLGTQVSATLSAITSSFSPTTHTHTQDTLSHENTINQYFTQIASFYHGENAFSLRNQAYDDMLWVVLGWLEAVKFIKLHSQLHHTAEEVSPDGMKAVNVSIWYAQQFIPQFAHRARVFYDLASHGWDTSLCDGGMVWNPHLAPYKNAITNELFIAASVGMYLYFPGDDNPSPFNARAEEEERSPPPAKAHDIRYLQNAVKAYGWLKETNMTNAQGLYVDGFHISGWRGGRNSSQGSGKCDIRDEKVYTYNQGVILSGLRGLWDATSSLTYLQDGHKLIRNVIQATGWENRNNDNPWVKYRWAGLGRNGIMEESCDFSGSCSRDGQTFKGVWWHHFAIFCSPLVRHEDSEDVEWDPDADALHRRSCQGYGEWVKWNADAAKETRNEEGEYGTWWGKHPWRWIEKERGDEGTDYRNEGVPYDELWRLPDDVVQVAGQPVLPAMPSSGSNPAEGQQILDETNRATTWDPNDRGRGRTVETQGGGLAVVRALFRWEIWY